MSIKKSAFDFFFFKILLGSKMLLFQELRYYRDSVTVILTASSLQTYVMSRAVTEQIVTQSRRLVGFSVSFQNGENWPSFTFLPHSLIGKRNVAMGKPTRSTKKTSLYAVLANIYLCAFRNWKCLHNYCRPAMKIPELQWCLTEITFNNPSQFPGMS